MRLFKSYSNFSQRNDQIIIVAFYVMAFLLIGLNQVNFNSNKLFSNLFNSNNSTNSQAVNSNSSANLIFLKNKPSTQPVKISPKVVGPSQTNPLFEEFPTWSQNFAASTSGKPSSKYWNVNQGIPNNSNGEAEYYSASLTNLHIGNGALSLEAYKQTEPDNYAYSSARIDTAGKQQFLYGRIDIEAEVPVGAGLWPAVWLLPDNNKYEDLSPTSDPERYVNGGEIDLIEEVGYQPNEEYGIVHTVDDLSNPNGVGSYNTTLVANGNTTYNLYSLLWTPNSIIFEVNNTPFYEYDRPVGANYTSWPFDQPFYLIMNLALGGSWGGEDTSQFPGNGIDNSVLPAALNIKSIYYYPYIAKK